MKSVKTLFIATALIAISPMLTQEISAYELPLDTSQKMKPATVKVQLVEKAEKVIVEAKGKFHVYNPTTDLLISSGSYSKRSALRHSDKGIVWEDLFPGTYQLRIVPADSQSFVLINGIQYKGCVEIYDNSGSFEVINEVDVENYLRSTLTARFKEEMLPEALNALAIVARTNAYYLIHKKPANSLWHVKASDADYTGYGTTLQNVALEHAISQTRHAILTFNDLPFAATWTENSAGKTADYASIYRKNTPSPAGVDVPLAEADRQKFGWSFTTTREQLAKIASLHKVAKISLFSEKHSGKVYAVKLSDGQETKDVDFFQFQKALGTNKLKSNDFTLEVKGDLVTFKGYGEGPGVGLCLHTTQVMAQKGMDADKILSSFFPGTKIEKLRSLADSPNSGAYK